jgi:cobalt/nickel transport system permease protein
VLRRLRAVIPAGAAREQDVHIPDGFLQPQVWVPLGAVSAAAVGYGARRTGRELDERQVPLLGVLGAFVFAAQMLNFPVAAGTSAHLLGAVLLTVLAGPWAASVVLAAVLVVQCLLFMDGGLTALGANFFNMGLLAIVPAALAVPAATRRWGRRGLLAAAFAVSFVSSELAAAAVALELALSGTMPLRPALLAMTGFHLIVGLGEGLATVAVLRLLAAARPHLLPAGAQS